MSDDLQLLREEIDGLDHQLLLLLAKRMSVSRRICSHKQKQGMTTFDPERERQLIKTMQASNGSPELTNVAIKAVWQVILDESKKAQTMEV